MIFFFNKKIPLYSSSVMRSDDPMGHTQSTDDKQSSEKPSERVIGYCVEHSAEHTPRA